MEEEKDETDSDSNREDENLFLETHNE